MNTHKKINELLIKFILGELSTKKSSEVKSHLAECEHCAAEVRQLKALFNCTNKISKLSADTNMCEVAKQRILATVESEETTKLIHRSNINLISLGRKVMKSRITKFAAAALIIIAIVLSINLWDRSIPSAAAQVLAEAAQAVARLQSIHIKAQMRTLPQDNFASIGLDYDFVPVEMWKRINKTGLIQWRIQKPERIAVMDGNSTKLLIRQHFVDRAGPHPNFNCYDCWCGHLMNVRDLLDSELQKAKQRIDSELFMRHENIDGREMIILEIDVLAQGDYTNDYLKNKFISESDHMRLYRFDAETKLLEGFEIYVHAKDRDVLVFEITDIEYNPQIDDDIFMLTLPENAVWFKEVDVLPDNKIYEQMTPKEVAQAFFKACANEDWDEYLKFNPQSAVSQLEKDYLGGLEIISIGEPFQSGNYSGWFVPYEIKLKSGYIKKHNLALRNDNPAKRYVVDGGI